MASDDTVGPVEALVEELRILARARSPLGITAGALPTLEALAESCSGAGDLDGVHALVGRACARLPRREADAVALLFADDDDRWHRNLTERMTLAGAELGFRYDAFRRRSGNDQPDSHYDRLLSLLAEALVAVARGGLLADAEASPQPTDDAAEPADDRAEAAPAATPGQAAGDVRAEGDGERVASMSRAMVASIAGALMVALLALLAFVVAVGRDGDEPLEPADAALAGARVGSGSAIAESGSTGEADQIGARTLDVLESVPVEGCDVPLGGSMNPVALPEGLEALIADAFVDTGGFGALGCPLRTVELWDRLWYQEFAGEELPPGRILADPVGGVAAWVDEAMYFHYERSGGGNLQTLGGLPVGTDYASPHPLLLLSGGGAMVAHYLGGPAHWVPVEGIEVWNDLGGADGPFGLPMADIDFFDGRPGQEWSGGYGERRDDGTIAVELVDAADIADAVAALPRRAEGILRLYDETAYWIDDQGRRRWIPDGETWACLGGADALIEPETPGWVVGAFAPGPNATCP